MQNVRIITALSISLSSQRVMLSVITTVWEKKSSFLQGGNFSPCSAYSFVFKGDISKKRMFSPESYYTRYRRVDGLARQVISAAITTNMCQAVNCQAKAALS